MSRKVQIKFFKNKVFVWIKTLRSVGAAQVCEPSSVVRVRLGCAHAVDGSAAAAVEVLVLTNVVSVPHVNVSRGIREHAVAEVNDTGLANDLGRGNPVDAVNAVGLRLVSATRSARSNSLTKGSLKKKKERNQIYEVFQELLKTHLQEGNHLCNANEVALSSASTPLGLSNLSGVDSDSLQGKGSANSASVGDPRHVDGLQELIAVNGRRGVRVPHSVKVGAQALDGRRLVVALALANLVVAVLNVGSLPVEASREAGDRRRRRRSRDGVRGGGASRARNAAANVVSKGGAEAGAAGSTLSAALGDINALSASNSGDGARVVFLLS